MNRRITIVTIVFIVLIIIPVNVFSSYKAIDNGIKNPETILNDNIEVDIINTYQKIAETDNIILFYEDTPSIAIMDKRSGYVWTSNVSNEKYNAENINENWIRNMNSLFYITYANLKDRNKQAFKTLPSIGEGITTQTTNITNGVRIKYNFKDLGIFLEVEITIKDDYLQFKIPVNSIKENKEFGIVSIEVMPFFGAADFYTDGYIFVPDGSGSLIKFNEKAHRIVNQNVYSWYVYGNKNVNIDEMEEKESTGIKQAMLPVFGVKHGNSAFLGIIDNGEYDAGINLYPSGYAVDLFRISPEFTFRHTYEIISSDIKIEGNIGSTSPKIMRAEEDMIATDRCVKYIFLSNEDANYSGMANSYRNYLQENKKIRQVIKSGDKIPLGLDIFMGIREERLLFDKFVTMTTFEEAKEIVEVFNSYGVDSMEINLLGWSGKGYGAYPINLPPESKLGGKSGLKAFSEYLNELNCKLFLQINLVDAFKWNGGFSMRNDVARHGNGLVVSDKLNEKFILNPAYIYKKFKDINSKVKGYNIKFFGYCYERFGELIYNDYHRKNPSKREKTAQIWNSIITESLESFGEAAIHGGNLYTLQYAYRLFDIPVKDSEYYINDIPIPFYQMVVHGSIPYSSDAGNLFYDFQRQKLKWIEYGCMPYFQLTYRQSSLLIKTEYNHLFSSYYLDWVDTATAIYKEFNSKLHDIWSEYMIEHSEVLDNLYMVRYSNGITIYINYNEHDVMYNNYHIKGLDYLVVEKGGNVRQ